MELMQGDPETLITNKDSKVNLSLGTNVGLLLIWSMPEVELKQQCWH